MKKDSTIIKFLTAKLSSKKVQKIFRWVVLGIILLLIWKSCFSSHNLKATYIIGEDPLWSNINLMGMNRAVTAFSKDLLHEIAIIEKTEMNLDSVNGNNLLQELDSDAFSGMLTSLIPSPVNQMKYVFSDNFLPTGLVLVTSTNTHVKGWNEFAKKIIAIPSHVPTGLDLSKLSDMQFQPYENILNALADLDSGKIDGAIFPLFPAYVYTKTFYEGKLQIATSPLTPEGLKLVAKNNPHGKKLIELFNSGLKEIKQNGIFDSLLVDWGLINADKVDPHLQNNHPHIKSLNEHAH